MIKFHPHLRFILSAAAALLTLPGMAQEMAWTAPTGITGDANLSTNGVGLDALMLNTSAAGSLAANGITFNVAANLGSGVYGDGFITYTGTGLNDFAWPGTFPTSSQASSAFAALMDAGGIFQFGGGGAGTITLTNLQPGSTYAVQVFNFAPDGDQGLTTFSGSPAVTLNDLPSAAGAGTYGEFSTATFIATNTGASFTWLGAGSSYTVIGAISVRNLSVAAPPQTITWGSATGITGDASLSKAGSYFDALMLNTSIGAVSADGITFKASSSLGGGSYGDGVISYTGSGLNDFSWPNSFPTSSQASSAFATLMNDGGIFQNGGSGTGTVTISGLTIGHSYLVQVFNFAPDGDAGLTTLSGPTPVTLNDLPGADGINTYGEFTSGTFLATNTTAGFNWNGAGSSYTVLGAISVRDASAVATIFPTNVAYQGDPVTLEVNTQPGPTYYQWLTDNGTGGASWTDINAANSTNYVLNTGSLAVGNYQFMVIVTNSSLNVTGSPVVLKVLAPSAPVIVQNITPGSASPYVGQGATFSAAFTGNHPINNQWQFSGDGGNTFSNLPAATNTTLSLSALQPGNAGEYRLVAANALGTNTTVAAILTVKPWSDAQIQWSSPITIAGMSAGQILTNVPGAYLEAADFFDDSSATINFPSVQYVFRSDSISASLAGSAYYAGQFITNAIFGSGALGTNSTGDGAFDAVLNQYYDGGFSNVVTLNNLIPGQQYTVQLFALDNRTGMTAEPAAFANASDPNDISTQLTMGENAYLIGTFTATNSHQSIQENLLSAGGFGNINALVVRALSYPPETKPIIVTEPREHFSLPNDQASITVIADGSPLLTYQWQAGPVGGPYTNLADSGRFSGTATASLIVRQIATNDSMEFVVGITNTAGGLASTPVDLLVPVIAQPVAAIRPVRITCIGASDVSSPTPYGTPNWPDYIAPMLGYEYIITNCGASGTTMIQAGNAPYWNTAQYTDGLGSSPDIVIIMLGSNDAKPYNWVYQTNYVLDYEEMINQYRNLPSHPRIYLNTLLTAYGAGAYDIVPPIVNSQLCPIIRQIAFDESLPVIDVNTATENMPQNFPDNIHPDIAGAKVVAQTVFSGLISSGETPPMIDRALNQPAFASSTANGNAPSNAVDADFTTAWYSAPSDNQWIYVDLGSALNVTGVYLNWGPDYGQSYEIQISSDAVNWTGIYTNNSGIGGIDRLGVAASGRYVRMLGLHSGTSNGYDLLDFTVTTTTPPPTMSINCISTNSFKLSWPVSSMSFAIQSTSNLASWTPMTNTISILGSTNCTFVTNLCSTMYYRLKQQL